MWRRQRSIRGAVVNGGIVVGLMMSHCLSRALLADQGAAGIGRGRRLGRVRLDGRSTPAGVGGKAGIEGSDQASRPEASSTSNSEERHGVRVGGVGWDGSSDSREEVLNRQSQSARSRHIRNGFSAPWLIRPPASRPKVLFLLHHLSIPVHLRCESP